MAFTRCDYTCDTGIVGAMNAIFVASVLTGAFAAPLIMRQLRPVVIPLMSSDAETNLPFSPNQVSVSDMVYAIILLVIKSFSQSLGLWDCQSVISSTEEQSDEGGANLSLSGPQLSVKMPLHLEKGDIEKFNKALGENEVDFTNNAGLMMFFLSAVTEPTMLLLLGKKQCAIKPLGSVNVENQFELLNPKACLDLIATKAKAPRVQSSLLRRPRAVKRGYEFDLAVDILVGDDDAPIFRQKFTMLQFARHKLAVAAKKNTIQTSSLTAGPKFTLSANDPFRWAALCKDFNPIHISTIGAKLFGMPGRIAHGNHAAAKAMATIFLQEPPKRSDKSKPDLRPSSMTVRFMRPVALPAVLAVHSSSTTTKESSALTFDIHARGKVCVECIVETI